MLADDIRDVVHRACQRNKNVFSPSFFDQHLVVVAERANRLDWQLGADDRSLIEKQWCMLIEPAKELIGDRYAATLRLLAQ